MGGETVNLRGDEGEETMNGICCMKNYFQTNK